MQEITKYLDADLLTILELIFSIVSVVFAIFLAFDKKRGVKIAGLIIGLIITLCIKDLQFNKEIKQNQKDTKDHKVAIEHRDSVEHAYENQHNENILYLKNLLHSDSAHLDTIMHIKDSLRMM